MHMEDNWVIVSLFNRLAAGAFFAGVFASISDGVDYFTYYKIYTK